MSPPLYQLSYIANKGIKYIIFSKLSMAQGWSLFFFRVCASAGKRVQNGVPAAFKKAFKANRDSRRRGWRRIQVAEAMESLVTIA